MEVGKHEKKGLVLNLETASKNKNLLVNFRVIFMFHINFEKKKLKF